MEGVQFDRSIELSRKAKAIFDHDALFAYPVKGETCLFTLEEAIAESLPHIGPMPDEAVIGMLADLNAQANILKERPELFSASRQRAQKFLADRALSAES